MESPYECQVLVCVFGPWCRLDNGQAVHAELKARAKAAGITDTTRVTKSGCLGQCGHGPMVAVWPQNVWYAGVRVEDADELFESLRSGAPVERLRYRPAKPGTNKTPDVIEREKAQKSAD